MAAVDARGDTLLVSLSSGAVMGEDGRDGEVAMIGGLGSTRWHFA